MKPQLLGEMQLYIPYPRGLGQEFLEEWADATIITYKSVHLLGTVIMSRIAGPAMDFGFDRSKF